MVSEDDTNKIVECLKKHGQTNTFKLATELKIDRHRILNIIKRLEEKQAVEVISGTIKFLKFPRKEKKVVRKKLVKKVPSKPKKKVKRKSSVLENLKDENKRFKEKISKLQTAPPKIVRRTILKKVQVGKKKLKKQAELIEKLEEKIKELQKKVRAKPKIIRRTIVKKIPVKTPPEIITKTVIKKVPIKVKEKITKKEETKYGFKLPKIDFSGLHKNIKRLHVPEILRK